MRRLSDLPKNNNEGTTKLLKRYQIEPTLTYINGPLPLLFVQVIPCPNEIIILFRNVCARSLFFFIFSLFVLQFVVVIDDGSIVLSCQAVDLSNGNSLIVVK